MVNNNMTFIWGVCPSSLSHLIFTWFTFLFLCLPVVLFLSICAVNCGWNFGQGSSTMNVYRHIEKHLKHWFLFMLGFSSTRLGTIPYSIILWHFTIQTTTQTMHQIQNIFSCVRFREAIDFGIDSTNIIDYTIERVGTMDGELGGKGVLFGCLLLLKKENTCGIVWSVCPFNKCNHWSISSGNIQ